MNTPEIVSRAHNISCNPLEISDTHWVRRLTSVLLALCISLLSLHTNRAIASFCSLPYEAGSWLNTVPATRSITRVEFRMECRDTPITRCNGGICGTQSAVTEHYYIRLYGKCSPTDCNWGEVEGVALTGASSGWYYFVYNQGFAKRYVFVRTCPGSVNRLRVYIRHDFTDPARPDYTTDEWFYRR